MSVTNSTLFEQTIKKPYADSSVSKTKLEELWNISMGCVENTLLSLRAVNFGEFGVFTFVQESVDVGRGQQKRYISPFFTLSNKFSRNYSVKLPQKHPALAPNIPITQINFSQISTDSGLTRDQVTITLQAVVRNMGELVRNGNKVSIDFKFAKFLCSKDSFQMKYTESFSSLVQSNADKDKPKHLRTGPLVQNSIASSKHTTAPSTGNPVDTQPQEAPPQEEEQVSVDDEGETSWHGSRPPSQNVGVQNDVVQQARPAHPLEKHRSQRMSSSSLKAPPSPAVPPSAKTPAVEKATTPKGKSGSTAAPAEASMGSTQNRELCDLCLTRDEAILAKEEMRRQEKLLENQIAMISLNQAKELQKIEEERQQEDKKRRKEIDEYNLSQSKKLLSMEPESYGSVLYARKEDVTIDTKKKEEYARSLQMQMEEKQRQKAEEKRIAQQIELELQRANEESHRKEQEKRNLQKKMQQQQFREQLTDQMNSKQGLPMAEITTSEVQYMANRLVSTSELKKRQRAEAKNRENQQLEVIRAKQNMKDRSKREEDEWTRKIQAQHDEELMRLQQEEADRKAKTQAETAEALKKQMQDKQRQKQQELEDTRNSSTYYPIGYHEMEEHIKRCQNCGRKMAVERTTKLINTM